ncbi:N-acetylmuramic acid 6-phosphate etherase [Cribrihabitans marinus]|uniref:N-acetylmuramic acid 6-phosphate etherase n=1 Tax=Cribrihabitans marinus TaxID=1227549 RepID=A0A1H7D0F1_9RHOB|nr:N-acetylmuramic acid 6-phosphate etherase [Cribrihabitans marinus]GGH37286.1 N-acetylmuramic acid 6-phosphate etherase [Cribrihabitans marinus]SEJ95291.1 N-acetylmuramic acid 6-phosphate etherase [Cribrihabitans marinus]
MPLPNTEMPHHDAKGLDTRPLRDAAQSLAQAQAAAALAPMEAGAAICAGAQAMARTLRDGGRLWYAAAGSSGLMAAADAMELGGTFGIHANRIRILMAGGLPRSAEMPGDTEDASGVLPAQMADLTAADTVIAVSASGTTPFTLAAAERTRACGATLIGIANNADSALLRCSDHPILLATPPEVIPGSTRMGAGTAQKIALNMLSTLMALELGHIHDGMMVNLRADNAKLRARAAGIVRAVTGADDAAAAAALETTGGEVKPAVLIAAGAASEEAARALLSENGGRLRPALHMLATRT